MAVSQEPILSRLHRLDNLMNHLEVIIKGSNNNNRSPKSSTPSTSSSVTCTSGDGEGAHASSLDLSPRSSNREKLQCRSIDDVMVEAEHKGTLLDRVSLMEHRLLKMGMQLEEGLKTEKQEKEDKSHHHNKKKKKLGFKQFLTSCVNGN